MSLKNTHIKASQLRHLAGVLTAAFGMACGGAAYAQKSPEELIAQVDTPETRAHRALEKKFSDYLKKSNHELTNAIVIIDPHQFYTGRALGLGARETIQLLTRPHGGLPKAYETHFVHSIQSELMTTAGGQETFVNSPLAGRLAGEKTCFIVPASEDLPLSDSFSGLPSKKEAKLVLLHEIFHCLAGSQLFFEDRDHKAMQDFEKTPDAKTPWGKAYLEALRINSSAHNESFADIGALGESLRSGEIGMETLEHVIRTREKRRGQEHNYMAAPLGINALAREIKSMGIEKFKALPFQDSLALYTRLTLETTPDVKQIADFILEQKNLQQQEKEKRADGHFHRRDADSAIKPLDEALQKDISAWNPRKELEREMASAAHTAGSAEDLVRAYSPLQTRLSKESDERPHDKLLTEKSIKLKHAYISYIKIGKFIK